jgi:hypothetical protein
MENSKAHIEQRRQNKYRRKLITALIGGGILVLAAGLIIGISAWNNRVDPSQVLVNGQPSLRVDQELIDFGDVIFDTPKTFAITLTNVGDEPLILSEKPYIEVREGC